jgi:hypothetical protein
MVCRFLDMYFGNVNSSHDWDIEHSDRIFLRFPSTYRVPTPL